MFLSMDTFLMTLFAAMYFPVCVFDYRANFVKDWRLSGKWLITTLAYGHLLLAGDLIADSYNIGWHLTIYNFNYIYSILFIVFLIGFFIANGLFAKTYPQTRFIKYSRIMFILAPIVCSMDNLFAPIDLVKNSTVTPEIAIGVATILGYFIHWTVIKRLNNFNVWSISDRTFSR